MTSTVFALSLDDYAYTLPPSHQTPDRDLAAHLHNIRSGHGLHPGHNRWYDKPFTLIVEANTRAGVLGEHSPVDALVPSVAADYAIVQGVDDDAFPGRIENDQLTSNASSYPVDRTGWERLDWVTDVRIVKECEEAARRAKKIVDDSDADELVFTDYGVDWIKDEGWLCPPILYARWRVRLLICSSRFQLVFPLTRSSRWRYNLRGIARVASSQRRTRPRSPASSNTAGPRQFAHFRRTAVHGFSRWPTRNVR